MRPPIKPLLIRPRIVIKGKYSSNYAMGNPDWKSIRQYYPSWLKAIQLPGEARARAIP
jgi:hypothetical protein